MIYQPYAARLQPAWPQSQSMQAAEIQGIKKQFTKRHSCTLSGLVQLRIALRLADSLNPAWLRRASLGSAVKAMPVSLAASLWSELRARVKLEVATACAAKRRCRQAFFGRWNFCSSEKRFVRCSLIPEANGAPGIAEVEQEATDHLALTLGTSCGVLAHVTFKRLGTIR